MKNIELLIETKVAQGRESLLLMLIGHFGDRLSKDVQKEIRDEIKLENSVIKKLLKRVEKGLK